MIPPNKEQQQQESTIARPMLSPSPQHVQGAIVVAPPLTVSPNLDVKFHPVVSDNDAQVLDTAELFVPALTNSADEGEFSGEQCYEQEQFQQQEQYPKLSLRESKMVLDFDTHPHLMMPRFEDKLHQDHHCEQPSIILDNDTFSISDDESMGDCFEEEDYQAMAEMPSFPELECRTTSVFRTPDQDVVSTPWPALAPARRTGGFF